MKNRIVTVFLTALLLVTLIGCGQKGNSVVGKWTVKEYDLNGETVSTAEIKEYLGETAAQNNDYMLVFTSNGNLVITSPNFATGGTNKREAAYTVQDSHIEVYAPAYPTDFELIEYDGDNILIDMGGYTIIMEKK